MEKGDGTIYERQGFLNLLAWHESVRESGRILQIQIVTPRDACKVVETVLAAKK
jgi:hypothetical protein